MKTLMFSFAAVASLVLGSAILAAGDDQRSTPKDVSIIVVPSRSQRAKTGNVKITFSDGHTAVLTHTGDCCDAKVSPTGNVGWIRSAKMVPVQDRDGDASGKMHAITADSLVIRLLDGRTKKFPPLGDNHFIEDWKFGDDDKTVVLRSHGYHGNSSYVQYDLASGKVINSLSNYVPYAELPAWAKPVGDPNS
jgi:hypothetical protein